MEKTVTVFGDIRLKVEVNPVDVIRAIHPIPAHDWIIVRKDKYLASNDKYIQITEEGAGPHSFEVEVGEVTKDVYEAWTAKETLIKFLTNQK